MLRPCIAMEHSFADGIACGYGPIDGRHVDLFHDLELLRFAAANGDTASARAAVDRLVDATRTHFAWEELKMSESRFPDTVDHALAHRAFLDECDRLVAELAQRGTSPLLKLWVEGRFSEWFRFHTRGQDSKLGRHLAWWEQQEEARAAAAKEVTEKAKK